MRRPQPMTIYSPAYRIVRGCSRKATNSLFALTELSRRHPPFGDHDNVGEGAFIIESTFEHDRMKMWVPWGRPVRGMSPKV
jgi:hypothetical protein